MIIYKMWIVVDWPNHNDCYFNNLFMFPDHI